MRRMARGFTIVELLIVISVIGILATISLVGFSRYQADSRDSQRSAQATIIAEGLEKYYDQNGEYPGCPALTASAATVTTNILPGTEVKTLLAPQDSTDTSTGNSIKCLSTDLTMSSPDQFAYIGDGSTVCSTGGSCLQFKLEYKDESTNSIVTISGRRQSSLLSSGDVTDLVATTYSFSKINLSWGIIGGASQYNIRYSTSSSMSSPTTFTPAATTNAAQVTGLSLGTKYYFQVQPASGASVGNWSNIPYATTYTLDTPDGTAVPDPASPASQIKYTWTTVANASSYTMNYSTSSTFSSPTVVASASQPYVVTGLAAGTTLYFRVQAVASGYTSGWSATDQATSQVPTPTCSTSTVNSNTQITAAWGAVTNATSYTLDYASNSSFTGATSISSISTTSQAVTGLSNGTTYYFRVTAYIGAVFGNAGTCPSAATGVDGPTSVGWSADAYGVRNTASVNWMPGTYPGGGNYWSNGMNIYGTCKPGATVVIRLYSYYATSSNTSQNTSSTQDWTYGNHDLYVPGGRSTWTVWWQGWVACQSGSTRVGDTYLGNAGPY